MSVTENSNRHSMTYLFKVNHARLFLGLANPKMKEVFVGNVAAYTLKGFMTVIKVCKLEADYSTFISGKLSIWETMQLYDCCWFCIF